MRRGVAAAVALLCILGCPRSATAQQATTACQGFAFGFTPTRHVVFVIKKGAPLYESKTATTPSGDPLRFGDDLNVNNPDDSGARIQVKQRIPNGRVGWIEKSNILCRPDALRTERTNLFLRAFVRTATFAPAAGPDRPLAAAESGAVKLTHNTNGECEQRIACVSVSRFNWFFVYAEENDHYLVSSYPTWRGRLVTAAAEPQFLGWLPKRNAILWPTALALRPSIELGEVRPGEREKSVCAYNTPENVGSTDPRLCSEVYGGRRWFTRSSRLAILEETDRYYRVAIAASLRGEGSRDTGDRVPGARVKEYKGVDIVFAVDGTGSMTSAIAAIKGDLRRPGLVSRINTELRDTYRNTGPIRFGFQVYRDSAPISIDPGRDGVREAESFKLSRSCSDNSDAFNESFKRVKAEEPTFPKGYKDPDYFENTFGGIIAAAAQFDSCEDHFKVLIVIGDHGYSPEAQATRGREARTPRSVAERIKGQIAATANEGARSRYLPAVVFVQTPKDLTDVKDVSEYDEAYKAFDGQARQVLEWLYKGLPQVSEDDLRKIVDSGVVKVPLTADAIQAEVAKSVKLQYRPDLVVAIRDRCLSTGQSVAECIDQVLGDDRVNAPVNLKAILRQNLCRDLGADCERSAQDSVGEAYIAKASSSMLSFDVMLEKLTFERWITVLSDFAVVASGGQQRAQAVTALMEKLQTAFVIDLQTNRILTEEVERSTRALPGAAIGKIFKYQISELSSDEKVPDCEIGILAAYAHDKNRMLRTIFDSPDRRPRWDELAPPGGCPLKPERQIPLIRNVRNELFAPANQPPPRAGQSAPQRYDVIFNQGEFTYYWLPIEYLP
jgi:hypothetical protein